MEFEPLEVLATPIKVSIGVNADFGRFKKIRNFFLSVRYKLRKIKICTSLKTNTLQTRTNRYHGPTCAIFSVRSCTEATSQTTGIGGCARLTSKFTWINNRLVSTASNLQLRFFKEVSYFIQKHFSFSMF